MSGTPVARRPLLDGCQGHTQYITAGVLCQGYGIFENLEKEGEFTVSETPEAHITEKQASELIEALQGTCDGIDDQLAKVLGIDDADYTYLPEWVTAKLDEAIFNCEGCGWWCEASEENDGLCADCF